MMTQSATHCELADLHRTRWDNGAQVDRQLARAATNGGERLTGSRHEKKGAMDSGEQLG